MFVFEFALRRLEGTAHSSGAEWFPCRWKTCNQAADRIRSGRRAFQEQLIDDFKAGPFPITAGARAKKCSL